MLRDKRGILASVKEGANSLCVSRSLHRGGQKGPGTTAGSAESTVDTCSIVFSVNCDREFDFDDEIVNSAACRRLFQSLRSQRISITRSEHGFSTPVPNLIDEDLIDLSDTPVITNTYGQELLANLGSGVNTRIEVLGENLNRSVTLPIILGSAADSEREQSPPPSSIAVLRPKPMRLSSERTRSSRRIDDPHREATKPSSALSTSASQKTIERPIVRKDVPSRSRIHICHKCHTRIFNLFVRALEGTYDVDCFTFAVSSQRFLRSRTLPYLNSQANMTSSRTAGNLWLKSYSPMRVAEKLFARPISSGA